MQVREERLHKIRKCRQSTRERRIAENKCIDCGGGPLVTKRRCDGCKAKHNNGIKNRKKELKAAGLCTDCGVRPLFTKKLCLTCRDKELAIYAALRKETLNAYGAPFCACCGESFDCCFLVLDHIHGGGNEHRKQVKAAALCGWLKRNNFPTNIVQVLCANCNTGKSDKACCPCKRRKEMVNKQIEMLTLLDIDNYGG